MTHFTHTKTKPAVRLIGDVSYPDFRDAVALLRDDACLLAATDMPPELVVVAQSRPGSVDASVADGVRRSSPLAGIVVLAGSWCEGEMRTGKPWPGVERLYWYQFPSWWNRQLALRAAGRCPDWAHPAESQLRISDCGLRVVSRFERRIGEERNVGLVEISTRCREAADVIGDVLCRAGYATIWKSSGRSPTIRGAVAGIWDGGQLSDREATELSRFCSRHSVDDAPVVSLLDFPRRDRIDQALELGATAVLGKPWRTEDLVVTLAAVIEQPRRARAA